MNKITTKPTAAQRNTRHTAIGDGWRAVNPKDSGNKKWMITGDAYRNGVLARIEEVPFRPSQDEANAMFIVRAANTHEAFRDTIVHARAALSVCADRLATPEETLRLLTNILTAEKVDDALLISGVATEEERAASRVEG